MLTVSLSAQKADEPSGKMSGLIFGDYYFNAARDTGFANIKNAAVTGAKDVHGLQFRRINLTYDYKFSSKFSSRIRLESDEANFTASSSDKSSKFGVYIKDAWVKWNFSANHELIVGIQPTNAFEVAEAVWGNRFLEKTILDLRGYVGSRDMAISLKGKLDSTGIFKYWLMYGNNSASKPESDKYKRFYANVEITPVKNLSITAYADYQTKADIKNKYESNAEINNDVLTAAFFVGYKVKNKYSAGVEAIYSSISNGYENKTDSVFVDKSGMGLSVFGSVNLAPKLAAFGRFDYFEPNSDSNVSGDKRNWYIAGLNYKPTEKIILSPNVIWETYEKVGAVDIKSSITPRISFSWTF
jgi:hypothetical protein